MKFYIKIIAFLIINAQFLIDTNAQNNLIISGGNWVNGSNNVVLNNTNFTNNSTFHAGSGTVIVTGNASTAQSQLGGSSPTTFYNLTIDKIINDASLSQHINVNNQFTFTSGRLAINTFNLIMGNSANFSGQNKDRYIQTNGTGFLIRQVGASWTPFPVGKVTFNPARLKNDGTVDNFKIRVVDHFLLNGTTGSNVTSNVVPKTWLIEEEVTGGSDVSMRLIWRPTHALGGFAPLSSTITHYTGGAWQDQGTGSSTQDNSYGSDHRYREATNITSFSPFGVKSGAPLPVELLYFYAEKEGDNVRLDWQTATELNNSHFDVEWSKDGINFEKIGEVAGAGTTSEVQFYEFLDDPNLRGLEDLLGLNYYRLKQVDLDGKFEYTNILSIEFEKENTAKYKIYPNPASDYLIIDGMPQDEMVQLFNVNGQLVKEFQIQSNNHQLTIDHLPSGTYFIKMGEQVKKLIIQK